MSQNGRSLISALNSGDYDAVDRIDLAEVDVKIVNHHVHELFERAIGGENMPMFEALLRIPRVQISSASYCALRHTAQLGLVEFMARLDGHSGVQPNLRDKLGFTALHHALTGRWSEDKSLAMVEILAKFSGIRINIKDSESRTALHHSLGKGWFKLAEFLVNNGGNPQLEDNKGQTPLSIGMMDDLPDSLFTAMLSFEGSAEDDPEDLPPDPDQNQPAVSDGTDNQEDVYNQMNSHKSWDIQAANQQAKPPQSSPYSINSQRPDPTPQLDNSPRAIDPIAMQQPSIRHTDVQVSEPERKPKPQVEEESDWEKPEVEKIPENTGPPVLIQDDGDFFSIMGVEDMDSLAPELTREYLLSPSPSDPRLRLHRQPVIEKLEELNDLLKRKGQALQAADFRRTDAITGFNLWHVAAATSQFELALVVLASNGEWPSPEDLAERTEAGKSIPDILEDSNCLSAALHANIWNSHPRLLAALLAQLPESRRQRFGRLISRTNLVILHS